MFCSTGKLCNRSVILGAFESIKYGKIWSMFFLTLHVLLYLGNVRCEILGVSYLVASKVLVIQICYFLKYGCSRLYMYY